MSQSIYFIQLRARLTDTLTEKVQEELKFPACKDKKLETQNTA